jgi:hypothetical protein
MRCLQIPRFSRGALVALLPCALAHADVVTDWNAIALKTLASPEQDAAQVAHAMATVHVAMFEVMNFIEGGYVPRFLVRPPAPVSGSGEAAAAAAAHYVLRELRPDRSAELDAALEHSLAFITDAQQKANARVWGRRERAQRHLGPSFGFRADPSSQLPRDPAPRWSRGDFAVSRRIIAT